MLVLECKTSFAISEPNVDHGFVTWLEIGVQHIESQLGPIGQVRVALIHAGEAMNYGESIHEVLDADSQELTDLDPIFFSDGALKEAYQNGNGQDIIYFADVNVAERWQDRMIEHAAVRRVAEVFGGGCAIAVIPVDDLHDAQRWESVGFTMIARAPTASRTGYVAMDLSLRQPRMVENDCDDPRFSVEATNPDED